MKTVVVGGAGALGRVLIRDLKNKGFTPLSIDRVVNEEASRNIIVRNDQPIPLQIKTLMSQLTETTAGSAVTNSELFAGVFCAAGGWSGGSIGEESFFESLTAMEEMNSHTAALASHIAARHLSTGGLLVLTGAEAALRPAPSMVGYGMSKVSTHYLLSCLAADPSFLAKRGSTMAVLPATIDTPMNRKYMPDADHSTWTKVGPSWS